ncbi:MAG: helix-turn-helix domain-containing protein, partial [Nitrospinota bacterium]|nr:helix-turn-helix domain-containing protein [Nitrospinota bacterium]
MAFKERLKIIIGKTSLRVIAQRAGISESAIRKWLKGETEPALGNLVALAQLAGVNVEWLATGDGPMRKGERSDVESPTLLEKLDRLQRRGGVGQEASPSLCEPEFREPIERLAERYGMAEDKLARIISDLGTVGVGEDFVMVPRYDVFASAGPGAAGGGDRLDGDRVVDRIAFRLDWLKGELRLPVGGLVVVRAQGDSMEPTIDEGDILLVDGGQERLTDGGI